MAWCSRGTPGTRGASVAIGQLALTILAGVPCAAAVLLFTSDVHAQDSAAARERSKLPGHVVDVIASEYAFRAPDTIGSGVVTFRLRQDGQVRHGIGATPAGRDSLIMHDGDATGGFHMLWVVRLDSGKTVREFFDAAAADVSASWARNLGGPGFAFPPRTANATLLLDPGNYVLVCFVGSGRPDKRRYHLLKGMLRPITVVEAGGGERRLPDADVVVTIGDSARITLSRPIDRAGVWRLLVRNTSSRLGGFVVQRVLPGRTAAEAAAWRRRDGGAPADEPWGGISSLAPGGSTLTTLELVPGTYIINGVGTAAFTIP